MSGHVYEGKRLTVAELITKLEAIKDKEQLVALDCDGCETWRHLAWVSSDSKFWHHGSEDPCDKDQNGDLEPDDGCDCGPLMVRLSG